MKAPVVVAALAALLLTTPAGLAADQTRVETPDQRADAVAQAPALEIDRDQIEPVDFFRYSGRAILRIWQDYRLRPDETVRDVVTVYGSATIDGRVDGDVVVVLGGVTLGSTAVVRGSVIVVAGDATVAEGAVVRHDLVVVGGGLNAPASFSPGNEYILVGTSWLGDRVRAVVPWFTHGLLWGRLIVPSLGWVWTVVGIVLLISVLINQLMHRPVGICADTLAARPLSAFLVGLLVLLLAAPLSVLLAATVIGVVVLPFFWAALLLGWLVGKVGVTRWIGRALTGASSDESPVSGLRSFLAGFVVIILLYMVPLLGLMTWAIVGVLGIGTATQSFLAAIRRERPAPAPRGPVPPPPMPPAIDPPASGSFGPPPIADPPGMSFAAADPIVTSASAAPASESVPFEPAPAGAAAAHSLIAMPRATFVDRLAALVIDALLVLLVRQFLVFREDGLFFGLLFAYFVGFWALKGTTIGGIICNLRVVRADGAPFEFADALVRGLGGILSAVPFGLGFLWILRDQERQAWHDRIAGTYVVRVPRNWPVG